MGAFLIINADQTGAGRGVRGQTLARFLTAYLGRGAVRTTTPDRLRRARDPHADTVFWGLPSSLEPDELGRIRRRRLIAFDYHDHAVPLWREEQHAWLRDQGAPVFRPWLDEAWDFGVPYGLLPVRRYRRFSYFLRWRAKQERSRRSLPEKTHDVAFAGLPCLTQVYRGGEVERLDQRAEWVHALKSEASDLRMWGGLVRPDRATEERLAERFGDVSDLFVAPDKIGFREYFAALQRSKVLLAPGGNAPWTYRHYEAYYANAMVVTIDFRNRRMLVPFPDTPTVHVPDGESVVPAVREALDRLESDPTLGAENTAHLERYWRYGSNSSSRPLTLARFLAQLG